jgi:hypothetical protein
MTQLIAKFRLDLSKLPGYLAAYDESKRIELIAKIDGFDVKIELISENSVGLKKPDEKNGRFFFNRAIVDISRNGDGDSLADAGFLQGRLRYLLMEYQPIVVKSLNRIVSFFKYKLRNPLLRDWTFFDFLKDEHAFYNPEWLDENGNPIDGADFEIDSGILMANGLPFLNDNFLGIQHYSSTGHKDALQTALNEDVECHLYEEFISDAQTSAIEGNYRRAVLELAIATEVYIKNYFFKSNPVTAAEAFYKSNPVAAATFEYLDDKKKLDVQVIKLIDHVAENAFSISFKKDKPKDYKNIDHLFRSRNSIAHQGLLGFNRLLILSPPQAALVR